MESLKQLFSGSGFMPHGHCYLWDRGLLSLHILSDLLIALAYFSIPFTLVYFVRKRKDLEFNWMFLCFAAFIIACGSTHLMEFWVIWEPVYWLSGMVKVITVLASVPTAILLVKLTPKLLALPSPAELREANAELSKEVIERKRAEQQIKESLDKEALLRREIHHRVKNNLQVISSMLFLQSTHVSDANTLEVLRESQGRARSIALIHERLYHSEDLSRIEFGGYLKQLVGDLFRAYRVPPESVSLVIHAEGIFLDLDAAIPCGLIINELVSNALKHGLPTGRKGEIRIDLHSGDGGVFALTVRDNGVGLPEDFDLQQTRTLGLKLVSDLARQLGGAIELKGNHGTEARVTFADRTGKDT